MQRAATSRVELHRYIGPLLELPWLLIGTVAFILAVGILMMYSAASGDWMPWAAKQLSQIMLCFPLMIIMAYVPIKFWYRQAYTFYIATFVLLIVVEIVGHKAMGATRWLNLGFMKLQPSEVMKLTLVMALARFFHHVNHQNLHSPGFLLPPLIIILLPFALIMKQPDLGTALILLMVGGILFFVIGLSIKLVLGVVGLALAALPVLWHMMHDYQKKRVMTFLQPETDPLGAGYNIIQSKIAIGSGGFFGKGLLQGSQSQLSFLPEHQTDFIFTMLAEELGFLGGFCILAGFMLIILYGLWIALRCQHAFGRVLVVGVVSIFSLHVFINAGMVMGLLPVVGAPLPLLSYGRTAMTTTLLGFGLLCNIYRHSQQDDLKEVTI